MNTLSIHLTFLSLTLSLFTITAQTRYVDDIFTTVTETSAIKYSSQVPQPIPSTPTTFLGPNANVLEHETELVDLFMDVYQPDGDQIADRPLIIFCFGGGFTAGSRGAGDMKTLVTTFAKKGYVTAAIDYRLGINLLDQKASERAVYRALQDSRAAIRYFRNSISNGNPYNIATDKIYLAGNSAGGFVSLHNAYMDEEERTPGSYAIDYLYSANGITNFETYTIPDLGCLDCVGDYQDFSGKANAIVSYAGALGSLDFINGIEDIPTLLFHSTNDMTVPYNSGVPYGAGQTALGVVYGSGAIHQDAEQKNAPVTLISNDTRGHSVLSPDNTQIYSDIIDGMTTFLLPLASQNSETLGVSDVSNEKNIFLVKNPIRKASPILIKTPSATKIQKVQVVSMAGQVLLQEKITTNKNNLEISTVLKGQLKNGVHLLKITTVDGKKFSKKLVVTD